MQVPGRIRNEGLRIRLISRTLGELCTPLGTPVVRTPEANEAGRTRFLTVRQVAEALRVSRATVYKAVASGSIPHVRVSNAVRIPVLAP
jgi:excisionase family DNA binding protein